MMKHRTLSTTIVLSVGLVCGLFAACAGETIPDVDDELITSVEAVYASDDVGGGAGGNGQVGSDDDDDDDDRGNGGRGGSATASAAGAAGAGDDNAGGAAGSAVAAAGAAGAAGAGGDGPVVGGAGGGAVAAACDGFPIIQENCGTGSCHGTGSNLGTFAASEDEFLAIIGEEGTICAGRGPLVDPADPEGSILIQKLGDDPPCGQPMPAGVDRLSPEDIECLTSYIGGL